MSEMIGRFVEEQREAFPVSWGATGWMRVSAT